MSKRGGMIAAGLMSGSSLDGVDFVVVKFEEGALNSFVPKNPSGPHFDWMLTDTRPYPKQLTEALSKADQVSHLEYLKLEHKFSKHLGKYIRELTNSLPEKHRPEVVGVHGHTVFHRVVDGFSIQMGSGSVIAHESGLPVGVDFRNAAIAAGGEGAPMAPAANALFTGKYSAFLNLGGIANVSFFQDDTFTTFDICACNQLLNHFAEKAGHPFDKNGKMASEGNLIPDLLETLSSVDYLKELPPKSLSNQQVKSWFIQPAESHRVEPKDGLHTSSQHIAQEIYHSFKSALGNRLKKGDSRFFVTGGGAKNKYLMDLISKKLEDLDVVTECADDTLLDFKEALLMARMAALRWRGLPNFAGPFPGNPGGVVGGALYLPPNGASDGK